MLKYIVINDVESLTHYFQFRTKSFGNLFVRKEYYTNKKTKPSAYMRSVLYGNQSEVYIEKPHLIRSLLLFRFQSNNIIG